MNDRAHGTNAERARRKAARADHSRRARFRHRLRRIRNWLFRTDTGTTTNPP